ncbi:hypothetical protein C8R44DRAFT_873447 [Mycena epipterygia]|nr:hypothetical protein C8R44DRAFT_873447 [Mycena epipterygia]
MVYYCFVQKPTWDDRAVEDIITIWDRWEPACDSCGRLESSLKERLKFCSYCQVAHYCSVKCQNYDWSDGSRHEERCHLFEINRKLSDAYSTMKPSEVSWGWKYGLGINDPTQSLEQKAHHWESLHRATLSLIQSTVFANKKPNQETPHLGVFLKLVENSPNHGHLSFIIDKVALIPFARNESGWGTHLMTGYCLLPGAKMPPRYGWQPISCTYGAGGTTLPPGFDLHRFITHVNRGITHFHGSYWPLPLRLSDADFAAAEPPNQWLRHMRLHHYGFLPIDKFEDTLEVFGVVKRDGTQVPLYEYNHPDSEWNGIFAPAKFDSLLEEMAKTDATEFKKFLDDPSRKLCVIPRKEKPSQKSKKRISKAKQDQVSKRPKLQEEEDKGEDMFREDDDSDYTMRE